MPIDREMDKKGVLQIDNGIWLIHTKEQNNAIFSNMDGPRDYHTKWSKSDKDKYHLISQNLIKNDTNGLIYKIETVTDLKIKHVYQSGDVGGRDCWIIW